MSNIGESFREAFQNNDSAQAREESFEQDTGQDLSGPSDTTEETTDTTDDDDARQVNSGSAGGGFSPSPLGPGPIADSGSPSSGSSGGDSGSSGASDGGSGGSSGGGSTDTSASGSGSPGETTVDMADAAPEAIQDRNEQIIEDISSARTAQQQTKQRAKQAQQETQAFAESVIEDVSEQRTAQQQEKQRAKAEAEANQLPDANEAVIEDISEARTAQQREKMQERAPDVEQDTEPAGPVGAATGAVSDAIEGAQQSPLGDVVGAVGGASRQAGQAVNQNVVQPGAELAGDVADVGSDAAQLQQGLNPSTLLVSPGAAQETRRQGIEGLNDADALSDVQDVARGEDAEASDPSVVEQRVEGFSQGLGGGAISASIGAPAEVAQTGGTALEGVQFTGEAIEEQGAAAGAATAGAAGVAFAQDAAEDFGEAARESPSRVAGSLIGGAAAGSVTTPVRVGRLDVPTDGPVGKVPRPSIGGVDVRGPDVDSGIRTETPTVEADISTARVTEGVAGDVPNVEVEVPETGGVSVSRPRVDFSDASIDIEPPGLQRPERVVTRGLRVETPAIAEAVGLRSRGKTLAGSRGFRPTVGAPSLANQADSVDLTALGTTGTATAEARSAFEADVFRETADDVSAQAGERFRAAEAVQRQAQLQRQPDFTVDSAEEAVGLARAVPDDAAEDVTQALRDTDATVFGSAAARAQTENFREPRDLDIVVDDKAEAKPVLEEALEGEGATVDDVFDIKETADVPGRAAGGEPIKFGRTSQAPRELGGVPFNPVGEELTRKAGASAFIREPDAAGTPEFDVGPEPRRAGRTDVREKDVTDTQMLADELNVFESTQRRFERAFDLETDTATGVAAGQTRRFGFDDRAQVDLGGAGRRTDTDTDTDTAATRRQRDGRQERAERDDSPTGRTEADTETPVTSPSTGTPTAGRGTGVPSPAVGGSDSGSPVTGTDPTSPVDTGDVSSPVSIGSPDSPVTIPTIPSSPPTGIAEPPVSPPDIGTPDSPVSPPNAPPSSPPFTPPSSPPSSPPSAPPSAPPSSPPTSPPIRPPANPPRDPETGPDPERGDERPDVFFGRVEDPSFTDFINPLTGERIRTTDDLFQ